jgi:hypothetical protein
MLKMNSSPFFHPHKIALISIGLFLLVAPAFSHVLAAEATPTGEVLAIGDAPVVKGNRALAKQAAISQALMKGVESYVVRLLGREGTAAHFEKITEEIIPQAQEAVESFHILAERQIRDRYQVLLRLKLTQKIVQERLPSPGPLTESPDNPILFLISEVRNGDITYWWKDPEGFSSLSPLEIALYKAFQSRGCHPVNRTLSPPEAGHMVGLKAADLHDSQIISWGRLFRADMVVYGQLRMESGKEVSLTAKAIHVPDGPSACRASVTGGTIQTPADAESLAAILEEAADRLAADLCPCLSGAATVGREDQRLPLTVTLAGIRMPTQFWRFSDFLSNEVAGVRSVIPCEIKGDTMSATVASEQDRRSFIHQVLTHPKRPFPMRLDQGDKEAVVFIIE